MNKLEGEIENEGKEESLEKELSTAFDISSGIATRLKGGSFGSKAPLRESTLNAEHMITNLNHFLVIYYITALIFVIIFSFVRRSNSHVV